jgi:hypothetical protein
MQMKDSYTISSKSSQVKSNQIDPEWSGYQMMCKLRRSKNPRHKNSTLRDLANYLGVKTTRVVSLLANNCVKITAVEYFKLAQIYNKAINENGKL